MRSDPLASFYLLTAAFCRGAAGYRATQTQCVEQVVKTQLRQWPRDDTAENLYGTWDPYGAFGEQNGRLGTTAVHVLMLLVYYRYVHLTILGP